MFEKQKPVIDSEAAEAMQKLFSTILDFKNSIMQQMELNKLTFNALVETLKDQLNFNVKDYNERVALVCQVFFIEKGVGSDEILNLEVKDVVSEKLDVLKLLLDVEIEGQRIVKDTNGAIYLIGNGKIPQPLETALMGKKVGDIVTAEVEYGPEVAIPAFANKTVTFKAEILSIKRIKNLQ